MNVVINIVDRCQWIDDRSTDILKVLDLFEAADLYGVDVSGMMIANNYYDCYHRHYHIC